jgi:cytochrome c6
MKKLQVVAFASALVLGVSSVSFATDSGEDTYKSKCAMCHGADGTSKMANVPPLGGAAVQGKSDADLKAVVSKGIPPKMPSFAGKLTEAQIDNIVAFIRTLKK